MEKTLVAVDELTGFIIAVILVRPDRNSPAGPETTFALRATACPQTG